MANKDNAPVSYTCSEIDTVISGIKEAMRIIDDSEDIDMRKAYDELSDLPERLEDLRSCNEQLREWGNDLYSKVEELEAELESIRSGIRNLCTDLENL